MEDSTRDVLDVIIPFLFIRNVALTTLISSLLKALLLATDKETLLHCIQKNLKNGLTLRAEQGPEILAFQSYEGIEPFVPVVVESLVNCSQEQTVDAALDFYGILFSCGSAAAIRQFDTRLLGPLLRLLSFRLEPYLVAKVLQVLRHAHSLGLGLKACSVQLRFVYWKVVLNNSSDSVIIKRLKQNFETLLALSDSKDQILKEGIEKSRLF